MHIDSDVRPPAATRTPNAVLHWSATGLFLLIFGFSGIWTLVDPVGARAETVALGYPAFTVIPWPWRSCSVSRRYCRGDGGC